MLTLSELKTLILKEEGKRDLLYEHSPGSMSVFNPLFDNEPCPASPGKTLLNGSIRPIGLQAFKRPGNQQGYGLHLKHGESVKAYMYRFSFNCEESKSYYKQFGSGECLWVKDELVDKVTGVLFSDDEKKEIIERWNNSLGAETASHIFRKKKL